MRARDIGVVLFLAVMTAGLTVSAEDDIGWRLDGGEPWKNRVGPGVQLAFGGNTCTDYFCDSTMDVKFIGSVGSTLSFYYRLIPNVVVYGDVHFGYVRTNYNGAFEKDRGFLFQLTAGGAFHVPITGWLDAYLGLGLGYALLRFRWEQPTNNVGQRSLSYRGVNIEMKIGADVYPISSAPTFAVGIVFRPAFPGWVRACEKAEIVEDEGYQCTKPEDAKDIYGGLEDIEQDPFLFFVGLTARYGF